MNEEKNNKDMQSWTNDVPVCMWVYDSIVKYSNVRNQSKPKYFFLDKKKENPWGIEGGQSGPQPKNSNSYSPSATYPILNVHLK